MVTMATSHVDIWDACLRQIKAEIPAQSFDTWFKPVRALSVEGEVLTLQVPSLFFHEYLEDNFVDLLRKSIRNILGPAAQLSYSIAVDPAINGSGSVRLPSATNNNSSSHTNPRNGDNRYQQGGSYQQHQQQAQQRMGNSIPNPLAIPGMRSFEIESNLTPGFTFDIYIEGDCNRLARAAGLAVAQKPGTTQYNPLFVYGGVGLGKTHLLHAIGNEIKAKRRDLNVLYISSEQFTNQFVDAIRNNTASDFMNFYQMIDVLLVDDIQFLAGKEKTQDNFFHVFNHLRQSGKQIVLASDKAPGHLTGLEERLISRFKWGLSVSLLSPDYELRKSILINKMYQNGIELPNEIVDFIASNITQNIRELEGALISLLAQSSLNRQEVSLDLARNMLDSFVDKVSREISIESIQKVVAEQLNITLDEMRGATRKREVVQARQIAMYFAKEMTKHSLKSIGIHFGGRDHSTVIHALQTVSDLMSTDREFQKHVQGIRKRLNISN